MTTEKALREALQEVTNILDAILAATGDYPPGADGPAAKARAALSLPETQGEPVAWVEVVDSYEGPYNFHGKELMSVGKHHLYAAPPSRDPSAAEPAGGEKP